MYILEYINLLKLLQSDEEQRKAVEKAAIVGLA